jgi:hypothetical protein
MKRLLFAAALAVLAASASAQVGVSVTVGHPGFYGRIEIGGFPEPRLVFPQPVVIEHVHVVAPPVYLHVPPGHAKNWAAHCHAYGACGQRVFFVQDAWYNDVYVPAYHERHGGGKSNDHGGGGKSHGGKGKGHKH